MYREHEVSSVPPPFSAFQMLETLNILEGYDLTGLGHNSEDYLHHLIEAIKLASADRLAYAYSPDVPAPRPPREDLRPVAASAHRPRPRRGERGGIATIPACRANSRWAPGRLMLEQATTHFACADAEGAVVSVTQTLGQPFGSGFAVPGTGVVLNNIRSGRISTRSRPTASAPGRQGDQSDESPPRCSATASSTVSIGTPGSYAASSRLNPRCCSTCWSST